MILLLMRGKKLKKKLFEKLMEIVGANIQIKNEKIIKIVFIEQTKII